MRLQIEVSKKSISSQSVMTFPNRRPNTALPYAFTEQGVAMLSGILNSDKAINMSIGIMRTAMENLSDEKAAERKWSERTTIGFGKDDK